MNIFTAIDVLEKNGIKTKLTTVNKDGKMKDALTIGTGSIVPTIYQENLDQNAEHHSADRDACDCNDLFGGKILEKL